MVREDRYSRQTLLPEIGLEGQEQLRRSKVVVIGCGALGTYAASFMARAGVGDILVVDRDIIEITNLQRQALFVEGDVGRPKAKATRQYLSKINSDIKVRGEILDINHTNVQRLVEGATVVLDAADNMETRFLVNDACVKLGIPWIYAGAVGTTGMLLCVVPGGPCLRCVFPSLPQPGQLPTCDTVGIINTLPSAIASLESTEAFKIMQKKEPSKELMVLDVWTEELTKIKVKKNPECECCGKRNFEFLQARTRKLVASLCGRNAVQIVPSKRLETDLEELRAKLSRLGSAKVVEGVLRFKAKGVDLTVFPDGRTVVSGTVNVSEAKAVFSKYVGD